MRAVVGKEKPKEMSKVIPNERLDVEALRADFPFLNAQGLVEANTQEPLHYLDNAASTQKPARVIDAISDCYRHHYAPIHRGLYSLAEDASSRYEQARATIARFIGAPRVEQLIFTRSTTESINMVARGWAQSRLQPGDQIWVSRLEHHSNFLPWQAACNETGAELRIIELHKDGTLNIEACAEELFGACTKLIAITHVSNVLGLINPLREIIRQAKAASIPVLVDAAQSVGHIQVNVAQLDCDFLTFSAHKMFGPSGIGALYAKAEHLQTMEPLLLGGGMVDSVGEGRSEWADYPAKFEAGSPNLAGVIGFAAAVDYIDNIGLESMHQHVSDLTQQGFTALSALEGVQVYGPGGNQQTGIVSFTVDGIHPHDLGQIAGEQDVAIRAGHHCCQPLMKFLGTAATARASFAPYNTAQDIDALVKAIESAKAVFA